MNTRTLGAKTISVFLCVCCVLSLASCGEKTTKTDRVPSSEPEIEEPSGIAVPSSASAYKGSNYQAVIQELQKAGFTNIQAEAVEDITSEELSKDGTIESISIDGSNFFEKKERFPVDASIKIIYHWIPKISIPIGSSDIQSVTANELDDLFTTAGFENVSYSEVYDLDPDVITNAFQNEVSINGKKTFYKDDEIPFDSKIAIVCHYPYEKFTVKVEVDFIGNLFFNKFDVNFLISGEKQGTLPHGEDGVFEVRLKEGEYELTFANVSSSSVKGTVSLKVDSDIDASYKIECFSDKVSVKEVFVDHKRTLAADEAKIMGTEYGFVGQNYKTVVKELSDLGFKNIKTVPQYDIIWGITETESVAGVTIGGKEDYKRGDVFKNIIEVIVTYHMRYEDDPARQTPPPTAVPSTAPAAPTATPNPLSTPAPEYDLDEDLMLVYCEQDTKYTSQYVIVFAEYDTSGKQGKLYAIDNPTGSINPRAMGNEFNAIGPLPSWFAVGETVHVQAKLSGSGISEYHLRVTQAKGGSGSSVTPAPVTPTPQAVQSEDKYMNAKGKTIFDAVIAGEKASNKDAFGDAEWYVRSADIGGVSFEVDSAGNQGRVLCVSVMDLMGTKNTDIFYKLLEAMFSGDDFTTANAWLKKNIGKEVSTKIGDANLVLRLTTSKSPILYIVDDEHLDWI